MLQIFNDGHAHSPFEDQTSENGGDICGEDRFKCYNKWVLTYIDDTFLILDHSCDEQLIRQNLARSVVTLSTGCVSMYIRIGRYDKMSAPFPQVTQCVIFYFLYRVFVKQQTVKKVKENYGAFRLTIPSVWFNLIAIVNDTLWIPNISVSAECRTWHDNLVWLKMVLLTS